MKKSELKNIIVEEVKKILSETDYNKLNTINIDDVYTGYITAAFWTEEDNDELEDKTIFDIDPKQKSKIYDGLKKFISNAKRQYTDELEEYDAETIGHNIWLSRNGHGAGFFDDNNDGLQKLAKAMGEVSIYVGDNGKVYFE